MSTETLDTFRSACGELGVSVRSVEEAEISEAITETIERPAVAVDVPEVPDLSAIDGLTVTPSFRDLERARTGITPATLGVAETGSVFLESTTAGTEFASLYPEKHVVILKEKDLIVDLETAFERVGSFLIDGQDIILATGPSATADMGDLVKGAHGPAAVHIIVVRA